MQVRFSEQFSKLPQALIQQLRTQQGNPFCHPDFLHLLEHSGCVGPDQGWWPNHLWIESNQQPVFWLPLYRKSHSWGEFVFDQVWAEAYQRYGLSYYPKWVTAIPFTPSMGPRWWCHPEQDEQELLRLAVAAIHEQLGQGLGSSWHLLFSEQTFDVAGVPLLARKDVQFHWRNHGYENFDGFLAELKSRKRKAIKKERQRVAEQGVELTRVPGVELTESDWVNYFACYANTYQERGMAPYLSLPFFLQLGELMAQQIMMVKAMQGQRMIAAALFFHDQHNLYGRHWGALQPVDCLHFEACFYQGIEFCIEHKLQRFDPGTQGEHKLLRGFEPVITQSLHLIGETRFAQAIEEFLQRETEQIERYQQLASDYLPYRQS